MFTLNCKGRLLEIDSPLVMGIINTTPDSFYGVSRQSTIDAVLSKAEQMIQEGAVIVDIGGQSTRPGSEQIQPEEELNRVLPAIDALGKRFPETLISIDTYHAIVAKHAVEAGASIVNDISAGLLDPLMLSIVGKLKVPYVCMHMKGTPQNMQQNPVYGNIIQELLDFFNERIEACTLHGIDDIIIDPGFGFGKTIEHNFTILREMAALQILHKPLLLGISRKSFIYKTLGTTAEKSLNGTSVLHSLGLQNGADILRVHDVKEAVEVIKILKEYHS
jgi:dihydropteroate synthase